ncbi:alpha/beta hydrolase [Hymenobacter lapidiphilus]|uniref:Alpha/beta fold hydrolase n=1 Tax=Hymenobacter lapidiphilus TaxID=2608003 RepID=A0A7Y7PPW0_9BACT|nr:alpha/beta fold hydrolase [Hymenobacter lapidiphilus]NVO31836.1 alpha/beta fold hydrolase [Hymenobacter lapidiphilus]
MNTASAEPTIVFITGAVVTSACWNNWKTFFEGEGYTCYAPAWPHKEAPAAELRRQHPHSPIAQNGLADVLQVYTDFIAQLPAKPIVIGHSFGGLIVQLLLQQNAVVAGVAIESAPPLGVVVANWSLFRSALPMLGLFSSLKTTFLPTFAQWQYAIANGLPLADQQKYYDQLAAPESKKLVRGALSLGARVDFRRPHAPLLFLAGGADRIMPAALNRANHRRYRHAASVTDYHELPGRCHAMLGQATWRADAGWVRDWLMALP